MKTQLLCTFTDGTQLNNLVGQIIEAYTIIFDKIYVFQNDDNPEQLVCTYNVDSVNLGNFLEKTISLHRKKQTNTLYTINALNCIIKDLNNGVLDKRFEIPWENYTNSLLLTTDDNQLNHIRTHIYTIVDTKTWKK